AALPRAYAQTLNDAVTGQLEIVNGVPCAVLLGGGDIIDELVPGPLFDICSRTQSNNGQPAPSGGGFAATPPSQPSAVESRLAEKEEGTIRRGFFMSAGYDSIDKEVSPFEDGYDSDVVRLAAGFDTLLGNSWVLGIVGDGSKQSGDFFDGGDFETNTYGITGFGSYLIGDASSFDFYAGYAGQSHDRARRATFTDGNAENPDGSEPFTAVGAPVADFDSGQFLFGVNFSHDWSLDNVTLGPRISYDYTETDYDSYTEIDPENSGLALTFHDDSEDSSIFSAGFAGSVAISTNFGVVLVEQNLFYRYEAGMDQRDVEVSFAGDPRSRRFTYQTDEPDDAFLQYSFISRFLLADNWEWMLEYTGISSHRFLSRDAIVLGFRKGF
ncbi:MAG: autotransporter outer membrane beta-barrel domain-containing protein, partial [Woeseiaceae bacterium]